MYRIKKIEIEIWFECILTHSNQSDMSFIDQMITAATSAAVENEEDKAEKKKRFEDAKAKRESELMTSLTTEYFHSIKDAIRRSSYKGGREKYMNFDREKCKANFPTLGTPAEVLGRWLVHMTDPESPYLVEGEDGEKLHLQGLKFDVWNNGAFTVHFTW